tara:strand:- start:593 stop:871 length:279 start_codon:yes stop_codon:yes gene_type:complete
MSEDKQVFEVSVTKKDGLWTGNIESLKICASDMDEGNMKTDLLTQLKEKLQMNSETHGAFVKRKWYVTVRPKRRIKEKEYDSDDMMIPDLFS